MIFLMMAFMSNAEAKKRKKGEGVKVSITVVDHDTNKPVATAQDTASKRRDAPPRQ